jgi:hypothetical protein
LAKVKLRPRKKERELATLEYLLNKEIEASRLSCLKPNSIENHAGIEVPART